MKFFKKSATSLALGAAVVSGSLMMGVSAPVQAVNIAQDGLGEALVFPYYTTRAGWSTLFNITNASNETVIIKVRWKEALNSRDARDFNVILSPFDVWTAVTRQGANGPEMVTADNSCTLPKLNDMGGGLTGIGFTNIDYTGRRGDRGPTSLDRAREGYFEVFNMGSIDNNSQTLSADALKIATYAKHEEEISDNAAMPRDCTLVRSVLRNRTVPQINSFLDQPKNVLKGRSLLVAGADGIAAGYDPLVLADFVGSSNYQQADQNTPNLSSADPFAIVINDGQVRSRFNPTLSSSSTSSVALAVDTSGSVTPGADAVSALISRSNVINDYNVKGDSKTSWVLTFPTKNFYVNRTPSLAPFASVGAPNFRTNGRSCFNFRLSMWDREEYNVIADQFSPPLNPSIGGLCYETNVLSFASAVGDTNLLGSTTINRNVIGGDNKGVLPADSGWAVLGFGGSAANNARIDNSGGAVGRSLPVIGMRVEIRNRGDATVNYGLSNVHAYVGDRSQPQLGLSSAVKTTVLEAKTATATTTTATK